VLFNSIGFITLFLPITLIGFFLLGRVSHTSARVWLTACSLAFYGWWSLGYLALLIGWITTNFLFGRWIAAARETSDRRAQILLAVGVALNLAALGYFKYWVFVVKSVGALTGIDFFVEAVVLPLGISFHTFQQIAYLVDVKKADAPKYRFSDYLLFVSYFPQLIAGPIVHHRELLPQLMKPEIYRFRIGDFSPGVAYFVIGLAKKVLFADPLTAMYKPVFDAAGGQPPDFLDAWTACLAFSFGLYFDFSGYSDMAVGLARMIGIKLPYNFASPYKAASIVAFWRQWHMTLSRWLRDYLYIPLGGSRKGPVRRYINLFITMLLGGLWHGASWTFVVWGGLHGLFLIVNHAWDRLAKNAAGKGSTLVMPNWLGRAITFLAVMMAWTFFAAPTFQAAWNVLVSLTGANGVAGPNAWHLRQLRIGAPQPDWAGGFIYWVVLFLFNYALLAVAGLVALFAPNSQEIVDGAFLARVRPTASWITQRPRLTGGLAGAGFLLALCFVGNLKAFVYFQF
jgi:D-alanyl-lipoteichoic acid acyltransferase DltB (MBOAT superfamily)